MAARTVYDELVISGTPEASIAVETGQFLYASAGTLYKASRMSDAGTEQHNQAWFASRFAGRSMDTRSASSPSNTIAVAIRGVADFTVASATTFKIGDRIAVTGGTTLSDTSVVKTNNAACAIGFAVENKTSATTIRAYFESRFLRHLLPYGGVINVTDGDKTLLTEMSGLAISTIGASATRTFTLPQTDIDGTSLVPAGTKFLFQVGAAQELRVDPGAAGALYIGGAKQTDDKYAGADAINEWLEVTADGNGDWLCRSSGTWTVES